MRVEDLARVCRVAVAVKRVLVGWVAIDIDSFCWSGRVENRGEVSTNLILRRHRGQLRLTLANSHAFLVAKEKRFVFDVRSEQSKSNLILFIRLLTEDVE